MADRPALSLVIPCYNSAAVIGKLVSELEQLRIEGHHEIILVNDGSQDHTAEVCRELVRDASVPMTFVDLARNFGEHNAVMAGLRVARGDYIITMDDDGQNPPAEMVRLYHFARESGKDVVYTRYAEKQHARWRNLGSRFANRLADFLLDKPKGLYLSTFRCIRSFVADEICRYEGPYPYVDGLILQVTQNLGVMQVAHVERQIGRSGYTLRRLVNLWLNLFLNFSVVPLRVSAVLGLVASAAGFLATLVVVVEALFSETPRGWGSLMSVLLLFCGVQLLTVGLVGEYVGRMYLTTNRRPQSVIRSVLRSSPSAKAEGGPSDPNGVRTG
jgi:undecaprenyl-phosphate 4-deoxy-4-formamido-L-arabinose transferase